jgi:hypothetical protein
LVVAPLPKATSAVLDATALKPTAVAPVPPALAKEPIATAFAPAAFALVVAVLPDPMATPVADAAPTVALVPIYEARAPGAKPVAATTRATATATVDLLLRLPRAEVSSEAATHAPSASFQILRYDLFIRFELGSQRD